jgi:hypothetical protein
MYYTFFLYLLKFNNLSIQKIFLLKKIGTATEKAAQIKLVEYGVSKETISLLAVPLGLITMIWPFVLSKFVAKHNPFMIYYNGQALK